MKELEYIYIDMDANEILSREELYERANGRIGSFKGEPYKNGFIIGFGSKIYSHSEMIYCAKRLAG